MNILEEVWGWLKIADSFRPGIDFPKFYFAYIKLIYFARKWSFA